MRRTIWQPVPVPPRTVLDALNGSFVNFGKKYVGSLPDFQHAATLLIGSDYSGEDPASPYLVYSFLLTPLEEWAKWEPTRLRIRKHHLEDSRRMSFKRLADGQRQQALKPLLEAANSLGGISFTLAISKRCPSLFSGAPPLDLRNPDFAGCAKWKNSVLEKAFVIVHLIGFLLAGLAHPAQNVLWFTDEDDIAANDQRVRELTQLFGWVSSLYLTFDLGHCRCGTSRCDDGSMQLEDFLAIPDLIAGAVAEQLKVAKDHALGLSGVFFIHRGDWSDKTRSITWWFSDCRQPLKRVVSIVDPGEDGQTHSVSWYHFHDQME